MGQKWPRPGTLESLPEYGVWQAMRRRCMNPDCRDYPRYGGRGITVCKEWDSYDVFLSDMGLRPSDDHQIERRDNDRGYSPENCRWATRVEQARNKSNNRRVTARGKRLTLVEWAEVTGLGAATIKKRLDSGWPNELALFTPARKKRRTPCR